MTASIARVKFARRQPAEAADVPTEPPPVPPTPPRGASVAAFAGVLDGRSLWLAIEAQPGSLALREATSGDVIALAGDLDDTQPAFRSIRVDLSGLPASLPNDLGETAYDVVLVPSSGRAAKQVWTPPLAAATAAVIDDGRWVLRRSDEGYLRLLHVPVTAAAELTQILAEDDGIRLTTAPVGELTLLGEADEVAATLPDDLLTAAAISGLSPQLARVMAGGLPIRRRSNDLTDPGRAVPLPELYADDPGLEDQVRLRLRWSGDGMLMARILDPDTDQLGAPQ